MLKHFHELPQSSFLILFSFPRLNRAVSKFYTTPASCSIKKRIAEQSIFNLRLAESSFPLVLFQLGRSTCCQNPINQPSPQKTIFTIGLCAHKDFSMDLQPIYILSLRFCWFSNRLQSILPCHLTTTEIVSAATDN